LFMRLPACVGSALSLVLLNGLRSGPLEGQNGHPTPYPCACAYLWWRRVVMAYWPIKRRGRHGRCTHPVKATG
jgi:hypothetical protein